MYFLISLLTIPAYPIHSPIMTSDSLPTLAVTAALAQNWKEAIALNTAILKENKDNIEAQSRLAYAYLKTGKVTLAKQLYEKVLSRDQYNQIAQKNLKKLLTLKKKNLETQATKAISPLIFLEEPGRTKVIDCIHCAPPNILSGLSAGQEVILKARNHCVELRTANNLYLGALPDDISFKLIKFLVGGNVYQAVVKSIEKNILKVMLREVSRGKRFINQPSFTTNTSYIPFSQGTTIQERPNVTPTGEEHDDQAPDEESTSP